MKANWVIKHNNKINFTSIFDETVHYLNTISGHIDTIIEKLDTQNQLDVTSLFVRIRQIVMVFFLFLDGILNNKLLSLNLFIPYITTIY